MVQKLEIPWKFSKVVSKIAFGGTKTVFFGKTKRNKSLISMKRRTRIAPENGKKLKKLKSDEPYYERASAASGASSFVFKEKIWVFAARPDPTRPDPARPHHAL